MSVAKSTLQYARHSTGQKDLCEGDIDQIKRFLLETLRNGTENPDFYGRLLDHMIVHADGTVEVMLRHLQARWVFRQ
jgi:hypothetical protein